AGAERGLEAVAGRRVADAGAGIDVVRAEAGADQLLDEEGLLVGAAAGGDAAERARPVLGLDLVQLVGGVAKRFFPADLAPGLIDRLADHRVEDAVLVVRIAVSEAALDAGVAAVGLAVLPRHHAHQLLAAHFGAEGAADAAISTRGDDRPFRQADRADALFLQCRGRAGLDAGAAAHAFAGEEVVVGLAGADHRGEAAAVDGKREGALDFVAGAHAARADDALAGVEVEVRVRDVGGEAKVVLAFITIANVAQADVGGLFLQLAVVVGRAGQAVERVVGDVELHHPAAQLLEARGLGLDLHAGHDRRGAARRSAARAFDLDQAHPARAERLHVVGRAELRDVSADFRGGPHHAGARGHGDLTPVDGEGHHLVRLHFGRAEVCLAFISHRLAPSRRDPPVY